MKELIEAGPPKWLADSAASSCMLCVCGFILSCAPGITAVEEEYFVDNAPKDGASCHQSLEFLIPKESIRYAVSNLSLYNHI